MLFVSTDCRFIALLSQFFRVSGYFVAATDWPGADPIKRGATGATRFRQSEFSPNENLPHENSPKSGWTVIRIDFS